MVPGDDRPPSQSRPPGALWLVVGGVFAANGVFQAVNDQPLLVVVLSLIAGLAALWAAWDEFAGS